MRGAVCILVVSGNNVSELVLRDDAIVFVNDAESDKDVFLCQLDLAGAGQRQRKCRN